jgi:hypothetical protein
MTPFEWLKALFIFAFMVAGLPEGHLLFRESLVGREWDSKLMV